MSEAKQGRIGIRMTCPACGSSCIVRSSKQVTPTYREAYLNCVNDECGWRGKGHAACDSTLSPSLIDNPQERLEMPPDVRQTFLREIGGEQ